VTRLKVGQSVIIPQGSLHRLSNEGEVPLCVIEIQIGDFLSEEDIERFSDDYGRAE
jgi:mannose-1-phosphate guanylyltransferase/mannose-6-phosphate isomerase